MVFCDNNPSIIEWGSEEVIIPYRAPDGRVRRYFPDFYIKVREKTGASPNILLRLNPRNKQHPRMTKTKKLLPIVMLL
jgi:hypothetical protein